MIDASHGNSQKQFKRQLPVIEEISEQIISGNNSIKGVMIESHLVEGNQKISDSLTYGQSITDACIGWEDTVSCLKNLSDYIQILHACASYINQHHLYKFENRVYFQMHI